MGQQGPRVVPHHVVNPSRATHRKPGPGDNLQTYLLPLSFPAGPGTLLVEGRHGNRTQFQPSRITLKVGEKPSYIHRVMCALGLVGPQRVRMDGRVLVRKGFQEEVVSELTSVSKGKQLNDVTPGRTMALI